MPENEELNPVEGQDVKDARRRAVADEVAQWLAKGNRITEVPTGQTTGSTEDE